MRTIKDFHLEIWGCGKVCSCTFNACITNMYAEGERVFICPSWLKQSMLLRMWDFKTKGLTEIFFCQRRHNIFRKRGWVYKASIPKILLLTTTVWNPREAGKSNLWIVRSLFFKIRTRTQSATSEVFLSQPTVQHCRLKTQCISECSNSHHSLASSAAGYCGD